MFSSKGLIGALMLCTFSCCANTNDDINGYQAEGLQQAATVPSATIEHLKASSDYAGAQNKTLIDSFLKYAHGTLPSGQKVQAAPNAILFVSFSMPESLLFALCDEAAAFNIPVVVNGLVDKDFKKTIETFARLNREAQKQHFSFQGISIDPLWFQQFQITSVPALVLSERSGVCEAQTICPNQTFDVVYGNASLKKSLELIRDKGDAAPHIAKTILEQGHV